MSKSRVEAFSDGVFAIAITLLVLEIPVPHVEHGGLADALLDQWPSYAAYVVSFGVSPVPDTMPGSYTQRVPIWPW